MKEADTQADPQHIYARWLQAGSRFAFAFGLVALVVYFSGAMRAFVPLERLPELWTLPAEELLREAHAPGGWAWVDYLGYGDYLNVLAIALFSLLSLVCVARVVPAFLRGGEHLQSLLAVLQVLVLAAAALNFFPGAR